ncbi:MAG: hypothetical protein QGH73_02140 [Rhodospirillales bacterium]|jgi:hypothetical protein|nr:hypothetical protein [Rhodospirillaceae bacterium]MDP6428904.1 hypothetical protein [Rhodospirillales bacterium]MDP6644723.1 hypothetical protein [Rhodospirillales bacterium]MDP6840455.1 hypothetical protein [Rhodospirillales bacterium]|tara:strand:- start:2259 stop:2528 length:270 start_codon:yes stop_codon:yes gene_type:complete
MNIYINCQYMNYCAKSRYPVACGIVRLFPRVRNSQTAPHQWAATAVSNKIAPDIILCGVQAEDDLQGEFGIMNDVNDILPSLIERAKVR